jgi:hypothetical protein
MVDLLATSSGHFKHSGPDVKHSDHPAGRRLIQASR